MSDRRRSRPTRPPPPGKVKRKKKEALPPVMSRTMVLTIAGLKAGIVGTIGMVIILILGQTQLRLLGCLLVPGFFVLLASIGVLAGILANDDIQLARHATQAAATAGVVTGIGAGVTAMILAAHGVLFTSLGYGVLAQFSPAQVENLAQAGITAPVIQLAGSVLLAFLIWGLGGTITAVVLGAIGGRIYFGLR